MCTQSLWPSINQQEKAKNILSGSCPRSLYSFHLSSHRIGTYSPAVLACSHPPSTNLPAQHLLPSCDMSTPDHTQGVTQKVCITSLVPYIVSLSCYLWEAQRVHGTSTRSYDSHDRTKITHCLPYEPEASAYVLQVHGGLVCLHLCPGDSP